MREVLLQDARQEEVLGVIPFCGGDGNDRPQLREIEITPEHCALCVGVSEVTGIENKSRRAKIFRKFANRVLQRPKLRLAGKNDSEAGVHHRQGFKDFLFGALPAVPRERKNRAWRSRKDAVNIWDFLQEADV